MAFQVELTDEAIRDIESIFEFIHADAPLNAVKWRKGLEKKLHLLTFMADRFGLAKESRYAPGKLQELFFGKFRILYTVRDSVAVVLTVRRGSRRFFKPSDIQKLWPKDSFESL